MSTSIESLDDTVLEALVETMPISSIISFCATNKNFKRMCDDQYGRLWVLLMERDFPGYLRTHYTPPRLQWEDLTRKRNDALAMLSKRPANINRIVNLPNSVLYNVNFSSSIIGKSRYFNRSNFGGANLSYAIFRSGPERQDLQLFQSNFNGAILDYAYFENTMLTGSCFTNASLRSAKFVDCEINDVKFIDANLENADFTDNDIEYAQFINANLDNTNFTGTQIALCNMTNTNLTSIKIGQTDTKMTLFDNCTLAYTNLSYLNLENMRLPTNTFENAICIGTLFTGSFMSESIFDQTNLTNADFTNAILTNVSFETSILSGTRGLP